MTEYRRPKALVTWPNKRTVNLYSPRKLIFNIYSPLTFSVILQYNSVILQSQIRTSLFGHLNNPLSSTGLSPIKWLFKHSVNHKQPLFWHGNLFLLCLYTKKRWCRRFDKLIYHSFYFTTCCIWLKLPCTAL